MTVQKFEVWIPSQAANEVAQLHDAPPEGVVVNGSRKRGRGSQVRVSGSALHLAKLAESFDYYGGGEFTSFGPTAARSARTAAHRIRSEIVNQMREGRGR